MCVLDERESRWNGMMRERSEMRKDGREQRMKRDREINDVELRSMNISHVLLASSSSPRCPFTKTVLFFA